MSEQQYLTGSVYLRNQRSGEETLFDVQEMLGEGAACVSYAAKQGGRLGVLKEFRPLPEFDSIAACALERNEQGQLLLSTGFEDFIARFREVQKEFEDCHLQLQKTIEENERGKDLSRFFPSFELYHGHSEGGTDDGTSYLWFNEVTARADTTFEDFCREIHKAPHEKPEYKLAVALHAVLSLTRSVRLLHTAGLLHRDIKPDNFGFLNLDDNMLTQFPRVFDLDSICSASNPPNKMIKTSGYAEPETDLGLRRYYPNVQTDIYAIGAVLFHAIIVTEDAKETGYLFDSEVHGGRLKELVDRSELIRATERNSHPHLRARLAQILKRCLCARRNRYESCDQLEKALDMAFYYIMPSEIAQNNHYREKWVLEAPEKCLDANQNKNSTLAIQYHLFEYPIYQHCAEEDSSINILMVGFGNYGQKFLDASLQAGQSCEKPLHVTVLSENISIEPFGNEDTKNTEVDQYLAERPALSEFFHIAGSSDVPQTTDDDFYGNITFLQKKLDLDDEKASRKTLEDILCEQPFHYVFIATGNDDLNRNIARAYQSAAEALEHPPVHICYASEGNVHAGPADIYPVWVSRQTDEIPLHPEIERMAFNVHRIWEKDWNRDIQVVRAEFQKKYNHDACVSHVLSIKYTLGRLGIPLESCRNSDFSEAARRFAEAINNPANGAVHKNELIYAEHRRWVTEKICLGWQKRDVQECTNWSTKDESKRRHVCIVRSRPDQKLSNHTNHRVEKWDALTDTDLAQYDALDQVSVKLHQFYRAEAEKVRGLGLLADNRPVSGLKTRVVQDSRVSAAFQEWFLCAKDVQNGDREKAHLYDGLRDSFLQAAEWLDSDTKKYVRDTVEQFDKAFRPVAASMAYQDLKQEDVKLIDSIPFILTYTQDACMVIPYAAMSSTEPFGNVAAATIVNPKTILYLLQIEDEQDIFQLKKSFDRTVDYMNRKHLDAQIDVMVLCAENLVQRIKTGIRKENWEDLGGRIGDVVFVGSLDALHKALQARQAGKRIFAVERNGTGLSVQMDQEGIYDALPSYRFRAETLKFECLVRCDELSYIRKTPCITVSDLFALGHALSRNVDRPEFGADYEALWEKYSEDPGTWKQLCRALKDEPKEDKRPSLVCLAKLSTQWMRIHYEQAERYRYIIPFTCAKAAQKIVNWLKEKAIIEADSYVAGYTTDSCEVVLLNQYGREFKQEYDNLFSNFYALMSPDDVKPLVLSGKSNTYVIEFSSLTAVDAEIPIDHDHACEKLLRYFNKNGYILNLRIEQKEIEQKEGEKSVKRASFTYGSRQIKKLLTMEGKILEVYVYHRIKELRRFDDVVTGFEVNWGGTDNHNEFDCIVTKGFCTLIVECKARIQLDKEECYNKPRNLTDQLGINAIPVLVADTGEERNNRYAEKNAELREYGEEMNIITIWKRNEIDDIGHILLRIMREKYGQ